MRFGEGTQEFQFGAFQNFLSLYFETCKKGYQIGSWINGHLELWSDVFLSQGSVDQDKAQHKKNEPCEALIFREH